jgi:hypothetical protein
MKYNKYKIITFLAIGTLFAGSCKKFLDVNTNPNIANNPGVELVLPSAQVAIAHVVGGQFQINGSFWAQYWTQSPLANQYKQYDQNQPSSDNYNTSWRLLYASALTDLNYVYNTSSKKNNKQYMAVAGLLTAYTFQVITDAWGDAPYKEALKALDVDGGIVSPAYDAQSAIYDGIVTKIDECLALIDENAPIQPGGDDLMYGGDMNKWRIFGNTLKLKVALRLSEINPAKSQAIITSISTDPTFNGFIMSASEEAKISFSTSGGSQNPLYSEIVGVGNTQNIYGSKTCIDSLNSNFDPRAYIFYNPTASGVVGIAQGDFNNAATAAGKSIASHYVGAEANNDESGAAPVKFISVYESLFLQAEATARGWLIGAGTDQELFEAGIAESFKAYLTDADVEEIIRDSLPGELNEFVVNLDYAIYRYIHGDTVTGYLGGDTVANTNLPASNWGSYPAAGTTQEKIRHIVTQKWFSMCGNQGFEAWTEWRRTGYPDFLVTSVNSLIGASKPVRFIYPTEEINLNANFPGVKQVTQKMWWDAN